MRFLLLFLAAAALSCTVTLPAPGPPPRYTPLLREAPGPLAEGRGRILVDAINGPARVALVEPTGDRFLCLSPCAVDLPVGTHTLHFVVDDDHDGFVPVEVRERAGVYQGIVGVHRSHTLSRTLTAALAIVGAGVTVWGVASYLGARPTGPMYSPGDLYNVPDDGKGRAAIVSLFGSAITLGAGAAALWLGDEEQPSTFVRWTPSLAAAR